MKAGCAQGARSRGEDPPPAPTFSLAPAPSNCPTAAPTALTGTATVTIVTNFGKIVIQADASLGANAAGTFVALSQCGYYNNLIFHRIVKKFIIQSGDGTYGREPNLTLSKVGQGGPDWTIKDDAVNTPLVRGMVALAEKSGQANSANSQFFIVLDDKAFPTTTNTYPIVGKVTAGMDIVDRIALVPTGGEPEAQGGSAGTGTLPLQPIVILTTTVTVP